MSPRRRPGKRLLLTLLPVVGLLTLGVAAAFLYLAYAVTRPPGQPYLLTPATFTRISARAVQATEETWENADGTSARGWLLRGAEGAPAVVLLHGYGSDRSTLLNLGIKLSEATNFTVLFPDLRGHGPDPLAPATTFGAREAEDLSAALRFLRAQRTPQQRPLVGRQIGLYGVELGGYAALLTASRAGGGEQITALALDSVPATPDALLHEALRARTGIEAGVVRAGVRLGTKVLLLGGYENVPACELARNVRGATALLLTGEDAGYLRASTQALAQCFPAEASVESRDDLPVTGMRVASSTGVAGETYDLLIIDFFARTLRADTAPTPR
ncbi:MAG TPA: alpha/beta fold hydrolase [Pyrinomonadaceae bacterium]|nr:alpha/beta fold hydrolase [Pyrinomonadaceae bacterium]